jgi:RNA polymerase sigma-54 factor
VKPALQFRLSQQLTMTPQLQQAIKLLQLSSQELESQLLEALESNPLLDRDEAIEELSANGSGESNGEDTQEKAEGVDSFSQDEQGWDHYYQEMPAYGSSPARSGPMIGERSLDIPDTGGDDLQQHLLWQLNLSHCSPLDAAIGVAVIEAINDDGYLTESCQSILETLTPDYQVELDEIQAVIHRIQQFDPIGVAASGVSECLHVQLSLLPEDLPGLDTARLIVDEYLQLLADQNVPALKRALRVNDEDLRVAIDLVRSLEPRPGGIITSGDTHYIRPDVLVKKIDGEWRAFLFDEFTPRLTINNYYAQLIGGAKKDDASYLREQLQEARWLIKSLETRNETLLKVANAVVQHQAEFFEKGEQAMKPLVLREVAETIEMHESTVSRVTSRKYMLTPRGVLEFKYFFSSQVSTTDGEGCSATAIQAMIRKLIDEEPPSKPLSDSRLAVVLNQRGIDVARRTVAKYREAINIPASSQRRRLI